MLSHTVMIWVTESATEEDRQGLVDSLRSLPGHIEQIDTYLVGFDPKISPGAPDITIMATYADLEAFNAYRNHAEHVRVVNEVLEPICDRRVSSQLVS